MAEIKKKLPWNGRQLRKRSSTPNCFKSKARIAANKKMWADPEKRAKMMAGLDKCRVAKKDRTGIPDGMRRAEADAAWAVADDNAKALIQKMKDDGELPLVVVPDSDDAKAEQALKEAFKIALGPLTHAQTKLAALRTVLEYTKSKPETKSKVTLDTAEKWLAEVAAQDDKTPVAGTGA